MALPDAAPAVIIRAAAARTIVRLFHLFLIRCRTSFRLLWLRTGILQLFALPDRRPLFLVPIAAVRFPGCRIYKMVYHAGSAVQAVLVIICEAHGYRFFCNYRLRLLRIRDYLIAGSAVYLF